MRTLEENKSDLVSAYRKAQWDEVKVLTQERQQIKKKLPSRCIDCGVIVSHGSTRCAMHENIRQFYPRSLKDPRDYTLIMVKLKTTRLGEILKARAEGKTLKEIALDLKISTKTVEYHWARVRELIGIMDTALITQWALKNKIAQWKV